jgi:hypothetical protein
MIAIALVATTMVVGLAIGCAAVDIHFDEQERRLKEKYHPKRRLRDWYDQRDAGRRYFARSGQSAQREPHGHRHVAVLSRFR